MGYYSYNKLQMGILCSPVRTVFSVDLPILSKYIYLYGQEISESKLLVIQFCQVSEIWSSKTQKKNNVVVLQLNTLENSQQIDNKALNKTLDKCFELLLTKIKEKQASFKDIILIEQPRIKLHSNYAIIFNQIIQKLAEYNHRLEQDEFALRIEVPWKKLSNRQKSAIINRVKHSSKYLMVNRLYMDIKEDQFNCERTKKPQTEIVEQIIE